MLALLAAAFVAAVPPAPVAPKKPVVDEYHGVKVTDDYRWLEAHDDTVKAWSDGQNAHTRAVLDAMPALPKVRARIDTLIRSNSVSYSGLQWRGGVLFAWKSDPKLQQPMLVTLQSADDLKSERIIVDPNALDAKGAIAMDWFVPSLDGKKVGVSLSKSGSESGDLHVYDVATAQEVGEVIPHVQNGTAGGSVAFASDGSGYWYTRYPRGNERPVEDQGFFQQVYFHKVGTKAETDTYELGKELPKIAEIILSLKDDGKLLLATVLNGDGGEVEFFWRPTTAGSAWKQLSTFADKLVQAQFGRDEALYLVSRMKAPKGKLLRLPLATPTIDKAVEISPESEGAIQHVTATQSRLYVVELLGGPSRVRVLELTGKPVSELSILPVSTVDAVVRLEGDEVLVENGSYLAPPAWFRFDAAGTSHKTALVQTSVANYSEMEVVRDFAISKDGTKIPVSIIKKKSMKLDGKNPTILYAYGGFGISQTPGFSASRLAWLEQGGAYAVANIRGGGEFGDAWHLDGNLIKKQNDYDDFYAAAKWLVDHKYTSKDKLAIWGGSNGGLLMGAAMTQHPEAYRAVISQVGIYDMLRVELTTNGAFNVTEYGTVKDPEQFKAMFAYSPLHHVVDKAKYPALLLTTGANDPRVEPWHSRKFAARLQAANGSKNPILLRTNANAGHGMGSSLDEVIAERADVFTFLFNELGVNYKPLGGPAKLPLAPVR